MSGLPNNSLDRTFTFSLDVMGGDRGPEVFIKAARFIRKKYGPSFKFHLHGHKGQMEKHLSNSDRENFNIVFTESYIDPEKSISDLSKNIKETSIWSAIASVKEGEADCVISSGPTSAIMLAGHSQLGTIQDIARPPIAAMIPTITRGFHTLGLDLGANIYCTPKILLQFAFMGSCISMALKKIDFPKVALLNIGKEMEKGSKVLKISNELLCAHKEQLPFDYIGFRESNNVLEATMDVIVTDGFSGNILLKTLEGSFNLVKQSIKQDYMKKNVINRMLLAPFLNGFLKGTLSHFAPHNYNGGILAGLNGIVVKSHGSANTAATISAIENAIKFIDFDIVKKIDNDFDKFSNLFQDIEGN